MYTHDVYTIGGTPAAAATETQSAPNPRSGWCLFCWRTANLICARYPAVAYIWAANIVWCEVFATVVLTITHRDNTKAADAAVLDAISNWDNVYNIVCYSVYRVCATVILILSLSMAQLVKLGVYTSFNTARPRLPWVALFIWTVWRIAISGVSAAADRTSVYSNRFSSTCKCVISVSWLCAADKRRRLLCS